MSQFTVTDQHIEALNTFIEKHSAKISDALNKRIFNAKSVDQSYRILNHWSKIGLLDEQQETDGKWRRFSIVDIILLKIYEELRGYGYPIQKLKEVRDSITHAHGKKYPFIEFAYCLCRSKHPIFLVVDKDGFAAFLTGEDISFSEHTYGYHDSYLKILFNDLLASVFDGDFTPKLNPAVVLSEPEKVILGAIRKKNLHELVIKMKDGKITTLDKKTLQNRPEFGNIANDINFGTVTIKKDSQKTVCAEISEKVKF